MSWVLSWVLSLIPCPGSCLGFSALGSVSSWVLGPGSCPLSCVLGFLGSVSRVSGACAVPVPSQPSRASQSPRCLCLVPVSSPCVLSSQPSRPGPRPSCRVRFGSTWAISSTVVSSVSVSSSIHVAGSRRKNPGGGKTCRQKEAWCERRAPCRGSPPEAQRPPPPDSCVGGLN